ncbi:NAD(P)-dependent dehydrogenase (short-subunit alcohol dehydrogenase family) [Mycetocola sp. CAN_C7]|uniref:SDR family NAD(P)-dependent oxidoreductase n=1 Tax=Mycetocola sp. CAN_C7 TaxID=2787724 RepID=UPI001A2675C4
MTENGVAGRTVLVAGATSAAGIAVCRALAAGGAHVIAVGSDAGRVSALTDTVPDVRGVVCDLADLGDVERLAEQIHAHQRIDGLIHLVGGWRGGGGLAGQTDEDWDFLERRVLTTLRSTTRVFVDDLSASDAGRLAIVSSTSVDSPAPGGANYATVKSAAETWVRAIARGFAKTAPAASATIFVVAALDGLESRLATEVVGLWDAKRASDPLSRVLLSPDG